MTTFSYFSAKKIGKRIVSEKWNKMAQDRERHEDVTQFSRNCVTLKKIIDD